MSKIGASGIREGSGVWGGCVGFMKMMTCCSTGVGQLFDKLCFISLKFDFIFNLAHYKICFWRLDTFFMTENIFEAHIIF
jgi:hypothetical protein